MSEEKMYAVKNDEGKYWDFKDQGFWKLSTVLLAAFTDEGSAKSLADEEGGHVVTLIEEPEKVVLTKEQAEIVEKVHTISYPAYYISVISGKNEELLMNAYVNGYTVEKEKKYSVKVPHTKDVWYYKSWDSDLRTVQGKLATKFTEAEIEKYGLQDCEKEECD